MIGTGIVARVEVFVHFRGRRDPGVGTTRASGLMIGPSSHVSGNALAPTWNLTSVDPRLRP